MSNQSPSTEIFSLNYATEYLIGISLYPHRGKLSTEKQKKISRVVATYFVETILWAIFSEAEKDASLLVLMEYENNNEGYELKVKQPLPPEQNRQNEEVKNTKVTKAFSVKELAYMLVNDPVYIPADIIVIKREEVLSNWVECLIKKILSIILWELEFKESPFMGWVSTDNGPFKFWLKPIKYIIGIDREAISAYRTLS